MLTKERPIIPVFFAAAGTVLCLTLNSNDDCLSSIQVNGVVSTDFTDNSSGQVNMSSADPDAIFLMQGTFSAIQNDGTFNYRTFDGRVLGAIQSRGDFQPFSVAGNNGGERISRIHPDLICLAQNTGGGSTEFYQYYLASEDHSNTQHNLLMNIFDMPGTWVLGTGSNTINEVPICGDSFTVTEGVTHGEWTGESNVDWFNCANWENYAVPDSTTDVIINTDTPDKNCDIDIDTYSATAARYGNVAYCNNLTIQGPSTGDDKKLIIEANNMNLLKVNGNLTISGYGLLDMDDGNPGSLDGTLQIKGNWDNQVGEAQFEEGNGSIEFNGDIQQQISANGAAEIFYNLEVDNSAGVLLNDDIEVGGITGALTLTDGVITTGSQKVYVTNISAASAITGYSESSYVNGNLRRKILSNGTYPFPVGDGTTTGNYKRMNVIASGLDLSGSPDYLEVKVESFTESGNDIDANLVATQSGSLLTNALESGLWTVTPSNSTISAGTWGAQLYVQNISNLSASDDNKFTVLKRTTGSTDYADWDSFDDDGTSIPSENTAGRIYDSGDGYAEKTGFTSFSELIIAKSPVVLPINLLDFSAQVNNDVVNLDWITLSEENNNYFTIERSGTDGDFKEIARIQGADNSNDKLYYNHIDKKPLQGCSYYRLKQTDYDETSTYSKPVTIYFNHMTNENKVYYSNENRQLHLYLNNNGNNNVQIYSSDGKMIYSSPLSDNDTSTISVSDLNLSKGVYIVKVFSNTETTSTKFVVY
ncbi:MAG: hypothetical protein C0594_11260 [Marinilabiliales bacterium]|nr:MAG: hypothetical protein C0594_11260 [Marinilabiliales bacterium]